MSEYDPSYGRRGTSPERRVMQEECLRIIKGPDAKLSDYDEPMTPTKQALLAEFRRQMGPAKQEGGSFYCGGFGDELEVFNPELAVIWLSAAIDRVARETWEKAAEAVSICSDMSSRRISEAALAAGHDLSGQTADAYLAGLITDAN